MLGSFDEAEDVVQEVMLQAWRRRGDLERPEHLRAWLYKIATNRCLDHLRATSRRPGMAASFQDVPWLEPYPDRLLAEASPADAKPHAAVVASETIALAFLAVLQLLAPRQRAALVLRDVLDWPAADVAELLDLEFHRWVANGFTTRVEGTTDWDAPAPVAGWAARDVVGHLVEWFPGSWPAALG